MTFNPQAIRLGRKPPRLDSRNLKFTRYLAPDLPTAPKAIEYGASVKDWGMLANDTLGDCVLPGTEIISPNIRQAYRANYSGDAVKIYLESGKKLSVTANHLVFTPRGAIAAKFIEKGDNLVGTSRPEVFPDITVKGGKTHIDQAPALAEDIFASLRLSRSRIGKIVPVPIHFHGDGQFINSNIDVVCSEGLLGREVDAALGKPHAQTQVGPAGELQRHFQSFGAALKRSLVGLSAFFGDICQRGDGAFLLGGHARIAQAYSLAHASVFVSGRPDSFFQPSPSDTKFLRKLLAGLTGDVPAHRFVQPGIFSAPSQSDGFAVRPEFKAHSNKATADGVATDADFISNLLNSFPGIVSPERVVDVEIEHYDGPVYDFGTNQGWYIANGIVTHNCTCAGILHMIMLWNAQNGNPRTFVNADAIQLYETLCGYKPGDPSTDQGGVELDILKSWRKTPIDGTALLGFVTVDPTNWDHVKLAHWLAGTLYMGLSLPTSAQDETIWSSTSDDPGGWGGHAVCTNAYGPLGGFSCSEYLSCITWGEKQKMTPKWLAKYCDELYAPITPAWFDKAGLAPSGFNLDQLQADLAAL